MAKVPQPAPAVGDIEWFLQDRFGMFIHWGTYALAARHEWVKKREEISEEAYSQYFKYFNPDLYCPREWARMAREAGMKYFVITAKHHEGFCLWDSKYTDYKVTNTPYGKDVLHEMVDAFRSEGLKVGFYYSLIDWHHPDFPIDPVHPMANHPDAVELNKNRDVRKYAEYMKNQVRELLTDFGKISVIWFDFSYPQREENGLKGKGHKDWDSENLLKMIRELQPEILINNRLDLPRENADLQTPEQFQPREWVQVDGEYVHWEACQTFSGSWGYHRDETTWKSPEQLIKMLINSVSTGGNLLMNVGPTARGEFDLRAQQALKVYADWMRLHNRSIYGCTQSEFLAPGDCRFTQNGKRLYLHIFSWPSRYLFVDGLAGKIDYAQLLNDASEVKIRTELGQMQKQEERETLILELPVIKPDVTVPVIELFLK